MTVLRILILAIIFCLAATLINSAPLARETGPDIQFEETEHDFGKIGQDEKHTYVFKIKNSGNDTLIVENVRTTCGCTTALLSSKEIQPQGDGELKVTFNSGQFEGQVEKLVYIQSNDPDKPVAELRIKAMIEPLVLVIPRSLALGDVLRGQAVTKEIKIIPHQEGVSITKVESMSEYLALKLSELEKDEKKGFLAQVTLSPKAEIGRLRERIKIHTTSAKRPIIYVTVYANIMGEVSLKPETFVFASVSKGDTASRKVTVTKRGEKTLEITKIENTLEWISTRLSALEKGAKYEITIDLKTDAPVGKSQGKLTIYTNNAEQPVLTANVFLYIKE